MIRKSHLAALAMASVTLTGCMSVARPMEVGPGVYSTSATGDGFRSGSSTRQHALESAERFCHGQGKHVQLVNADSRKTRLWGVDTTVDVTFSCVDATH
jgi:hypothetical protein